MKYLNDSVLVFIHIKKTGGISLQRLLSEQYGSNFFGGHIHTELRRFVAKNPIEQDGIVSLPNGSCVCKHWKYEDFHSIQERANFITIVREPSDRIVCHYNFYLMHYPKGQSFMKYIHDPKNINLYSRFLPQNLDHLSEVYFFENLQDSINDSKILTCKDLPRTNATNYIYTPTKRELYKFRDINEQDMALYRILKT